MVSQNNNQNNGKINDGRIEINGKVYQTVAYRLAEFRKQFRQTRTGTLQPSVCTATMTT